MSHYRNIGKCVAVAALAATLTVSSAWAQGGRAGRAGNWGGYSSGRNWSGRNWDGGGRHQGHQHHHHGYGQRYGYGNYPYYTNQYQYPNQYRYDYVNPVPQQSYSQAPITIRVPSNLSGRVVYSLNNQEFAMMPGQSQTVREDRHWLIRFDRGGQFGAAEYSLSAGSYEFRKSARGWDLYRLSDGIAFRNNGPVGSTY